MRLPVSVYILLTIAACNSATDRSDNKQQSLDSTRKNRLDTPKVSQTDSIYTICRLDDRAQRVFIVTDSILLMDIAQIRKVIQQIDNAYKFRDDLRISFVSKSKYCGYKTELEEQHSISFYEFYLNYLGEYTKSSKVFWTYPALPDKKRKYIID